MSKGQVGEKARQPRKGIPLALDHDKIAKGLVKCFGNVTRVADSLGCSRHSLSNYIQRNEDLKQVLHDTRERRLDELEDTALSTALAGNVYMCTFLLKSQGKSRGYSMNEHNGADEIAKAAFDYIANRSKSPVTDSTS